MPWGLLTTITPGELAGLEIIVNALEAEQDLRAISNASAAFAGGQPAKSYVRNLQERIRWYADMRCRPRESKQKRRERTLAELRAFQAMMGSGGGNEGHDPCPPA